ncbi:MAG: response regulator transcription factor [Pyrinomonadaceae bacterium]|nr:response regulator transcription factor [Pyrinomonadaceae bacterium]
MFDVGAQIEILIVDDFPVVRAGLRTLIEAESDMRVAAEAENGREAIEIFKARRPDVVLMGLLMPEMNGLESTKKIYRDSGGDCRVIALTGSSGHEAIYQALKAGAKAYLLKTASPVEILKAIRHVAAGKRYLPPSIRERLAERTAAESLTRRELEVLELIIHGLSNAEIAARLGLTEGTVKGHVNRILGKIQVTDRTQAALAAMGRSIFLWTENETTENFARL